MCSRYLLSLSTIFNNPLPGAGLYLENSCYFLITLAREVGKRSI